jgi:hypothetical protein
METGTSAPHKSFCVVRSSSSTGGASLQVPPAVVRILFLFLLFCFIFYFYFADPPPSLQPVVVGRNSDPALGVTYVEVLISEVCELEL